MPKLTYAKTLGRQAWPLVPWMLVCSIMASARTLSLGIPDGPTPAGRPATATPTVPYLMTLRAGSPWAMGSTRDSPCAVGGQASSDVLAKRFGPGDDGGPTTWALHSRVGERA